MANGINSQSGYTNQAYREIACQLFDIILEHFLTSNFGLKTYLSTRIRHGVLEGEIRQCFDGHHILLEQENNMYNPINYWKQKFGLSQNENIKLMGELEYLSRNVTKTIDDFKRDVLQIKQTENELGMFVYLIDDDSKVSMIIHADEQSKGYEGFCNCVMDDLFRYTSYSLDNIRAYVRTQFATQFDELLLKFEDRITEFQKICKFYDEMSSTIQRIRDSLNYTMPRIESWFRIQDVKFDDFYLDDYIAIMWNIIQRSFANVPAHNTLDNMHIHVKIASGYCMVIGDIMSIIFNNMFQYSMKEDVRKFVTTGEINGSMAHLHFENKTSEDDGSLNSRLNQMLSDNTRLQQEGRSGLSKVKQLLSYDLKCENNRIDIQAKEGRCITDIYINLNAIKA